MLCVGVVAEAVDVHAYDHAAGDEGGYDDVGVGGGSEYVTAVHTRTALPTLRLRLRPQTLLRCSTHTAMPTPTIDLPWHYTYSSAAAGAYYYAHYDYCC